MFGLYQAHNIAWMLRQAGAATSVCESSLSTEKKQLDMAGFSP